MYMLDSSTPPTAQAIAQAARDGVVAWAGYVSSPGHPQGWTAADFARVREGGLIPVFVDVGTPSGLIGAKLAAVGAERGDHVVTDIEPGGALLTNAGPWCAAVADDGYVPWVYGTWATVNAAPAGFAVKWGAAYGQSPDTVRPGECVQFANTHAEYGMEVDTSAVGAEVFNMVTLDTARAIVRLVYLGVMHREADEQGLEYWAAHFVAVGLDKGIADMVDHGGEPGADLADDYARDHTA